MTSEHQIPLETFEGWLVAALTLLKAGSNGGRLQIKLLQALRKAGNSIPENVEFEATFFRILEGLDGVQKKGEGSNPTWKLMRGEIPKVLIPRDLSFIIYPPDQYVPLTTLPLDAELDFVVGEVTLDDLKRIAPSMRAFVKDKQPLTKAQVVAKATDLLGRDLPDNKFGKLCFLAQIAHPDISKDAYVPTRVGRGRKKNTDKPKPSTKNSARIKKQRASRSAETVSAVVVAVPLTTTFSITDDQTSITLNGDVSSIVGLLNLPISINSPITEVTMKAGVLTTPPKLPWVRFSSSGGSVGIEINLDITIQLGRINIAGPWKHIILRYTISY